MIIYTDNENRIVKSGINEYEIPDTHSLAKMSETKRLCYVYEENGSFYPYVSTDIIEKFEEQADENKIVNSKIQAQSEQMDFYEDCIVEMAEIVYA